MPASRTTTDTGNAVLYAMVVFIVLFLAATVLAIVLYLNNEQYVKDADEATGRLARIATDRQYRDIQALAVRKGSRQYTALDRIGDDFDYFVKLVRGADADDVPLTGARAAVSERVGPLWDRAAMFVTEPELTDPAVGLAHLIETLITELESWQRNAGQLVSDLDSQTALHRQTVERLQTDMDALKAQLEKANRAGQTQQQEYQAMYSQQGAKYEEIVRGLEEKLKKAQEAEKTSKQDNKQLRRQVAGFEAEVKKLNERLQMFQPRPETEAAALEPDGYIISVVARDKIAYINLASNDHLYRGLTFAVYDSFQNIPKTGQDKGTLEVTEIGSDVSKCRITGYDPTNPIMDNDIIANLVYSTDKKYLFCVAGDFDFDNDGQIDSGGRARIKELIENWGGRTSDELTVETDFLVVGQPPVAPEALIDELDMDSDTPAARRRRQAAARAAAYDKILERARTLDVPTFNQQRFFYFIGREK